MINLKDLKQESCNSEDHLPPDDIEYYECPDCGKVFDSGVLPNEIRQKGI